MNFNLYLIIGIVLIALLVGMTIQMVGQPIECIENETFEAYMPFAILSIMGIPMLLGYLGGRVDNF